MAQSGSVPRVQPRQEAGGVKGRLQALKHRLPTPSVARGPAPGDNHPGPRARTQCGRYLLQPDRGLWGRFIKEPPEEKIQTERKINPVRIYFQYSMWSYLYFLSFFFFCFLFLIVVCFVKGLISRSTLVFYIACTLVTYYTITYQGLLSQKLPSSE